MGALRVDDLISIDDLDEKDLILYQYPNVDELENEKIEGIFLGHYFNWDSSENRDIAIKNGFKEWEKPLEGSYFRFENLDNYQTGIHDYFAFLNLDMGELQHNSLWKLEEIKYPKKKHWIL